MREENRSRPLTEAEIKQKIAAIVRKHTGDLPGLRVFLFGSRATRRHSVRSDFDIGLECNREIPLLTLARIREEVEQLPILQNVDIVDFKRVSAEFANFARQEMEEL